MKQANASEVKYAFDAVSEHNSYQNISRVLSSNGGKITLVLPPKAGAIPDHIEQLLTLVGTVHKDVDPKSEEGKAGIKTGGKEVGFLFSRLFSRWLEEGWFAGHPYEVVPGGLNGVEQALTNLKKGVNSATKYVFRIAETK